ncbi:MAG: UvrD-helicase domain-containing protein [Verrucomicrobiales bacterium]|nr:UvrD-helicase domain-containing protein [Verrucomicrobiales bacterium]MDE2713870.1 UvrD-helicase domain-containing protein [Verrucomicrobiota bacterium]
MSDLSGLNPEQRKAAATLRGPVLILAGAGTGKTRTLTHRVAHMVSEGISPGRILAVTFTNKAAREMQQRVTKQLKRLPKSLTREDGKPLKPTICTFHSLCVRILRRHIEKLGYKRNFVIYSDSEQLGVVKKVLSAIAGKDVKADARELQGLLSRLKNAGPNGNVPGNEDSLAMAGHIRRRYDSALRAANAVDFDDLLVLTLRVFNEFPEALEECRARYQYVMVDEYQDTNAAQFELMHLLSAEHRNVCVVGDDDQSIYGWRGAEISNILDMEKHFPEVKVIKLEQNYRSTRVILDAANAVIKNNPRRRPKQLWSAKGAGDLLRLESFANEEEEARTIVDEIEFNRMAKRIPWKDHAILFRTNVQSRPLETALRKAEVRYHLIGGQSFFDRREIRDFLAFMKTFINPNDDASLLRIANIPARGLSDVTMERLLGASQERDCSVWKAMKNDLVIHEFQPRTRKSIEAFVGLIEDFRAPLGETELSLASWADKFLDEIDYAAELRKGEKDPENAENRMRNLRDLISTMDDRGGALLPANRLGKFLDDITLDADREADKEDAGDAVTLITTHSCKGLEFPHVFLVGVEEGLLPHSRSAVEGTLDEERRLFYVAITRAMKTLTISHCLNRKKYGQNFLCHPSSFLKELPEELCEDLDSKKEPVTVEAGKNLFAAMREGLG